MQRKFTQHRPGGPAGALCPGLAGFGRVKFNAPPVPRYTLSNGLTAYLVKDNTLPVLHVTAFIKAGSSHDPAGKAGLAQLAAALIRDGGTANRGADDIDKELEYLGASIETAAYTEEIHAEMTALRRDADKVLDIYADILMAPAFEEEKTAIARDESLELILRRNDNPSKAAVREARRRFYGPEHPYGRRPEEAGIKSISKADLAAFHASCFKPGNVIMAVSGDFASDGEMLAALESRFGGWKGGQATGPEIPPPAHKAGRGVFLVPKAASQASIAIMQPGLDRVAPENLQLSLLTEIIGGGFQSRLFTEVRSRRGLAYSVYSSSANLARNGFIYSFCGTKPETCAQALSEMLRQFALAGSAPVSPEELERSKGSVINPFVFKFSTPHKLAVERALEEFYGFEKGYLDGYVDGVSGVDSAALLRAGRHFSPDNALIFVIGDPSKFDRPLSEFGPVTELKED